MLREFSGKLCPTNLLLLIFNSKRFTNSWKPNNCSEDKVKGKLCTLLNCFKMLLYEFPSIEESIKIEDLRLL